MIAVVVAVSAAAVYALTGAAPPATVLGYVPAGSVMYGEFRMDLPGGQDRKVAEFLSHFPGFADQSSIQTKVNETLDQIVGKASSDKQTFGKDIQPWFEGEIAFSVGQLPDAKALSASKVPETHALLLLSIKNAALAQDWFDQLLTEGGSATATTQYGGTTITTPAKQCTPETGMAIINGKVAVIGDLASVKSAIDTNGAGAFANEPGPKAAFAAADGSHLGLVYMAIGKLYDWSASLQSSMLSAMPSAAPGVAIAGCDPATMTKMTTGLLPDWATFTVKADSDALEFEAISPPPAKAIGPTDRPDVRHRQAHPRKRHRAGRHQRLRRQPQAGDRPLQVAAVPQGRHRPAREVGRPGRRPRRHPRLDRRHRHRRQRHGPAARGGHRRQGHGCR